jgi:hypothetical protein
MIAEVIDYYREHLFEAVSNNIPLERALDPNINREILELKRLPLDKLIDAATQIKERIIGKFSELQRPVNAQYG